MEQISPETAGADPCLSQDAGPDGQISFDNSIFYLHENTLLVGGEGIVTNSAVNE